LVEIGGDGSGRPAARRRHVDLPARRLRHAIGDPGAIRRKTRRKTSLREQSLFASQCRDDVDSSSVATGLKRDLAAVSGEGGLDIVCSVMGQSDWRAIRHLLNPDIEVALAAAVGGIREDLPVGGDSWVVRPTHI
jgi:hypothetical protein